MSAILKINKGPFTPDKLEVGEPFLNTQRNSVFFGLSSNIKGDRLELVNLNKINNGNLRVSGEIRATSFATVGGKSSGFLKADGTIDDNKYLTVSPGQITSISAGDGLHSESDSHGSAVVSIVQEKVKANDVGSLVITENGLGVQLGTRSTEAASGADSRFHTKNTDVGTTSDSFYIGDTSGPKIVVNRGDVELKNSAKTEFVSLTVKTLITENGTNDGFLKADGTIDTNRYLTSHDIEGGVMNVTWKELVQLQADGKIEVWDRYNVTDRNNLKLEIKLQSPNGSSFFDMVDDDGEITLKQIK